MDYQTLNLKLSLHEAQFLEDLLHKTGVPECKKDLLWQVESIVYELKLVKSHMES